MKMNLKLTLLFAMLCLAGSVVGQEIKPYGFAGKDFSIFFIPTSEKPTTEFSIGDLYGDETQCLYSWEVVEQPEGSNVTIDDCHACWTPVRNVTKLGEYIFKVLRVSKFGYQTETVIVGVTDQLTINSIKMRKKCYQPGEIAKAEDFEFDITPEGYQTWIKVTDDTREVKIRRKGALYDRHTIEFEWTDDVLNNTTRFPNKLGLNVFDPEQKIEVPLETKMSPDNVIHFIDIYEDVYRRFGSPSATTADKAIQADLATMTNFLWELRHLTSNHWLPRYIIDEDNLEIDTLHVDEVKTFATMGMHGILFGMMCSNFWKAPKNSKMKLFRTHVGVNGYYGGPTLRFDLDYKMPTKAEIGVSCRDDNPVLTGAFDADFSVVLGVDYDVPIPYLTLPGFGGFFVRGTVGGGVGLRGNVQLEMENGLPRVNLPIKLITQVGLGVAGVFVCKSLLSVEAMFTARPTFDVAVIPVKVIKDGSISNWFQDFYDWIPEFDTKLGCDLDFKTYNLEFWCILRAVTVTFTSNVVNTRIGAIDLSGKKASQLPDYIETPECPTINIDE